MKNGILIILLFVAGLRAGDVDMERIRVLARESAAARQAEVVAFARIFRALQKSTLPDSAEFDQFYYDLKFEIRTNPQQLTGDVTGRFRARRDGLQEIKLNFDSREDIGAWSSFSVEGNLNSFFHSNGVLRIQLDRTYQTDEEFSLRIKYQGLPRSSGLKGFEFDTNSYGDTVISTLSEPYQAQTWWPCKDDPADKLDSLRITITVPENMVAASNGLLLSNTLNGNQTRTFVWNETYPITTYLVSLAVSPYATFSDSFEYAPAQYMPIEYFVYPQELSTAQAAFQPMPEMLRVYSELFGLYPFVKEKYGHAHFVWGGAMEHQTCTSIGRVAVNWEAVYAHELAHQWFGNLVTCKDWHHIWINEGFATYSEALWVEQAYGHDAYHEYIEQALPSRDYWGTDAIYRSEIDNPGYIFQRTVYDKGAWTLHMLRRVVGDSTFFRIMNGFPNQPEFRFGNATTEQFRDYCESVYGKDLDWFFDQWIYQPSYPQYDWGYEYHLADGIPRLYLEIRQRPSQAGYSHLYRMPIDIQVRYSDGSEENFVVLDSLPRQSFDLAVREEPVTVRFDPDQWLLKNSYRIPVTRFEDELSGHFLLYPNFPNPFNGVTSIPFAILAPGNVRLEIFDTAGRRVRLLANGFYDQGDVATWRGRNDAGKPVASGVYICRLQAGPRVQVRKLLLVK